VARGRWHDAHRELRHRVARPHFERRIDGGIGRQSETVTAVMAVARAVAAKTFDCRRITFLREASVASARAASGCRAVIIAVQPTLAASDAGVLRRSSGLSRQRQASRETGRIEDPVDAGGAIDRRRSSLGSAGITTTSHFAGLFGSGDSGRASKRRMGRGASTAPKRREYGRCDTAAGALLWADAAVAPIATTVTIIAAVHRGHMWTSSPILTPGWRRVSELARTGTHHVGRPWP
jgi:hypothetical protein